MDERKGSQKRCAGESSSSSSAIAKANDFVAQHAREHDLLETIQALRKEQKEQREKKEADHEEFAQCQEEEDAHPEKGASTFERRLG